MNIKKVIKFLEKKGVSYKMYDPCNGEYSYIIIGQNEVRLEQEIPTGFVDISKKSLKKLIQESV